MDLGLDVTERDGWAVLSVTGEVDVYTAPKFRERLIELVSEGKYQIVVDLEGVDFLDSTGLGVLVGGLKRLRSHEGDLVLVCTQSRILKVFEITGLTKVFSIHDSVDAAVVGRYVERRAGAGDRWLGRPSSSRSRRAPSSWPWPAWPCRPWPRPTASWPTSGSTTSSWPCPRPAPTPSRPTRAIDTDERVVVRCWVDEAGLEVRISDRGAGFDPSELPDHPPVTDPARLKFERGLGIPLIRALVDVVEFSSSDRGTEVRLVMRHGQRRRPRARSSAGRGPAASCSSDLTVPVAELDKEKLRHVLHQPRRRHAHRRLPAPPGDHRGRGDLVDCGSSPGPARRRWRPPSATAAASLVVVWTGRRRIAGIAPGPAPAPQRPGHRPGRPGPDPADEPPVRAAA